MLLGTYQFLKKKHWISSFLHSIRRIETANETLHNKKEELMGEPNRIVTT